MKHEYPQGTETLFRSKLEQRVVFFFVAVGVVSLTYGFFLLIDFLPEEPSADTETAEQVATAPESALVKEEPETPTPAVVSIDPLPTVIVFDTLDKEVRVLNPESDDVQTLDNALREGVVRHPGSGSFTDIGTIFILGHSSYLPKVNNKNFQAFNGIQKLAWGDTIRLRSSDREYVYAVDRVYEAKASSAEVPIEEGAKKLVLATCNSFGTKDDRFVVEATLVSEKPLNS